MAASELNSPTIASPGYANTQEKQELDLKALVRMLLEEHMKDINKSLKEIQDNMGQKFVANKEEMQNSLKEIQEKFDQQAEVMKEETQKSLKVLEENTNKQMTGTEQKLPGSENRSRNN